MESFKTIFCGNCFLKTAKPGFPILIPSNALSVLRKNVFPKRSFLNGKSSKCNLKYNQKNQHYMKINGGKIKIAEEQGEAYSKTLGKEMKIETEREPHEPE